MKRDEIRLECLKLAQPCRDPVEAVAKARAYEKFIVEPEDEAGESKKSIPKNSGNPDPLS